MAKDLPRLQVGLTLDSATFIRETNKVIDALNKMQRQNATIARSFGQVTTAVNVLKSAAVGLVGALSFRAFTQATRAALDTVGSLQELATAAGVTVRQLQILQTAALTVGIENEQLQVGLQQLAVRLSDAEKGTGDLAETMIKYGIAVRTAELKSRPVQAVFLDIAEAVQNAASATEKAGIAADAFGSRLGPKLLPLLNEGNEGWARWTELAEAAGIATDAQVAAADRAGDAIGVLQATLTRGFQIGIIKNFASAVDDSVGTLRSAREAGETFGQAVGLAMRGVAAAAQFVAAHFREFVAAATALVALRMVPILIGIAGSALQVAKAIRLIVAGQVAWNAASKGLVGIAAAVAAAGAAVLAYKTVNDALAADAEKLSGELAALNDEFGGLPPVLDETIKAEEDLRKLRIETVKDLIREADAANVLLEAYRQGGDAVRDSEILIEAENVTRKLKIGLLSKEGQAIFELIRAKRLDEDASKRVQAIDEAILRAQKALTDARANNVKKLREAQEREAERARELMEQPFINAMENIQSSFADTFEEIFTGGVTTFSELASEIKSIFIRLAAEMAALMVIRPVLAGVAGAVGVSGFESPIAGTAGAAGVVAPSLASKLASGINQFGTGFGFASGRPGPGISSTGVITGISGVPLAGSRLPATLSQVLGAGGIGAFGGGLLAPTIFGGGLPTALGGGLGGAGGAGLGFTLGAAGSLGGPLGALIGGGIGTLAGGLLGSLFGGGGGTGNQISGLRGALGVAGAGGTGEAAKFVQSLDKQLIGLLDARSKAIVDRALRAAPGVSVRYGEEGPSENDLARLAASRIRPAAQALGLRNVGTAEQLSAAISLRREIEGLDLSPTALAIRDLRDRFRQMTEQAREFGISTKGLPAAFREAKAAILEQNRAQKESNREAVLREIQNLTLSPVAIALRDVRDRFRQVTEQAKELGISTRALPAALRAATAAIKEQAAAQISQLALSVVSPFKQLLAPLEAFQQQLKFADLNPRQQFQAAERDFRRIAELARAGSTIAIGQLQGAGELFIRLAEQVGASPGGVSARADVASVVESVMKDLKKAQDEASRGLQETIRKASRDEIDTLKELIEVGHDTVAEIKKLRRAG